MRLILGGGQSFPKIYLTGGDTRIKEVYLYWQLNNNFYFLKTATMHQEELFSGFLIKKS